MSLSSRRPSSASSNSSSVSSNKLFGKTFLDGERLDAKRLSAVGGMTRLANAAWSVTGYRPNDTHLYDSEEHQKSKHIYINKGDSGLGYSTQKRGAAKTVIPGDVSKPLFLKQALNFINEELRIIGAQSDEVGSPRRLQVYGQFFDFFIQEFKTYESILTDVKREYDVTIERQKNELSQFEITKSKLSIMDFKMAKEIQRVTDSSKATIQDVLRSKQTVQDELHKKNIEIQQLKQKIDGIYLDLKRLDQERQLREENNKEAQELKALTREYENLERKTKDLLEKKDKYIAELMAQKKKVQSELLDSTTQMGKLKSETVGLTKEAFNALEKKLADEETHSLKLLEEKEKMASEYKDLVKTLKDTKFALQKSKSFQNPDWEYIQSQFTPSIKQFVELAKKLDYNDAIIVIIREALKMKKQEATPTVPLKDAKIELPPQPKSLITPIQKKAEDDYFTGKGLQLSIPKYLRTKYKVLNRHLSKHNTLLLINDTWDAKAVYEATNRLSITLGEFLYIYLKKRFGSQEVICEWGYNLTEACAKYKEVSVECSYFLDILNTEMNEEVYSTVRLLSECFKNSLYRCDVTCNFGTAKGYLEKSEFIQLLTQIFPYKSKKQMQELEEALNMDQSGDMIIYKFLCEEGSNFLDTLKMQLHQDRETYIKDLEHYISKMSKDDTISVFEAEKMLKEKDQQKKEQDRRLLVSRGFGIPAANLKPKMVLSKKKFLDNLKKGVLLKGDQPNDIRS